MPFDVYVLVEFANCLLIFMYKKPEFNLDNRYFFFWGGGVKKTNLAPKHYGSIQIYGLVDFIALNLQVFILSSAFY